MHIIFSETKDFSTNNLIDWFIAYNVKFLRYNGYRKDSDDSEMLMSLINIRIIDGRFLFSYKYDNQIITTDNIDSVYFRRPNKGILDFVTLIDDFDELTTYIRSKQKDIGKILKDNFIQNIKNSSTNVLGNYDKTSLNKLDVLLLAGKFGLLVPDTIITNSLSEVIDFFHVHNNSIICKSIAEVIFYYNETNKKHYSTLTIPISKKKEIVNSFFSTSLFQENIPKDFEVRTFYLDGSFYSAAIFSQSNVKTKIDFRNYDDDNPNRIIPYKLPGEIEKKITLLMKNLKLNIGSIDLIVNGNKHYFLEINPVGQYDFISYNCNYNLDFHIANYLINGK